MANRADVMADMMAADAYFASHDDKQAAAAMHKLLKDINSMSTPEEREYCLKLARETHQKDRSFYRGQFPDLVLDDDSKADHKAFIAILGSVDKGEALMVIDGVSGYDVYKPGDLMHHYETR